jgi:hypothetical protein
MLSVVIPSPNTVANAVRVPLEGLGVRQRFGGSRTCRNPAHALDGLAADGASSRGFRDCDGHHP